MGTKGFQGSLTPLIRIAVLCTAMVGSASAAPVLLGLWRFDETAGDTANDSSGLGHHGTLYGEQGNVPGRVAGQAGFGQALFFTNNGIDHCTVNVPGSPLLMIGMTADDTWTISAWVQEASDGFGNFVANYGRVFAQDGGLGLNLDSGANGDAEFWIWHNSLTAWQQGFGTSAAAVPVLDQWVHLALVYDGQNLTLYRNGNQGPLGAKTSLTARSSLVFSGYTGSLQIGTMPNMAADRNWHGMVDDFAVFKGALTETQVRTIQTGDFSAYVGGVPKIASETEDQVANPGWGVSLSVAASSDLPMTYQWRFNGANLLGATNATLALTNVQNAQAGAYIAVINNAVGAVTSRVAVLTVSVPHPPALVGLWRFDEGTGDQAYDSSGLHNDGTLVGEFGTPPGWVTSQPGFGSALQFQYWDDHAYVAVPGDESLKLGLSPNALWSMTIWAYEQSDGGGGYLATYGRFLVQDGGLGIQWDSGAIGDSQVYLWHGTLGAWQKGFGGGSAIEPLLDQWVHWALVYDGNNLTLYRNGNQSTLGGKVSLPVRAALTFNGYTGSLQIGSQTNMFNREWNGMLDDVAVFSGALTEAQVRTAMTGDFSAFPNPHPQLSMSPSGGKAVLTWSWGVLQSASEVNAAWQDETNSVSPLMVTPSELRRFYRVRR